MTSFIKKADPAFLQKIAFNSEQSYEATDKHINRHTTSDIFNLPYNLDKIDKKVYNFQKYQPEMS